MALCFVCIIHVYTICDSVYIFIYIKIRWRYVVRNLTMALASDMQQIALYPYRSGAAKRRQHFSSIG